MAEKPGKLRTTVGGLALAILLVGLAIATFRPRATRVVDVKEGFGPAVRSGDTVSVHYVGQLVDGKEFDSSKRRGIPFEFRAGGGMVIQGWDHGIIGMKPGGVRRLIIPPSEGYGSKGAGPSIPPNSTLLFEVELLQIK